MDNQTSGGDQSQGQSTSAPPDSGSGTDQQAEGQQSSQQDTQEHSSRISRVLNNWLRGGGQQTTVDADENASGEGSESAANAGGSREAQQQPKQPKPGQVVAHGTSKSSVLEGDPNEPVTLTREELRRTVQSERDRQVAAENRRNSELAQIRATAAQFDMLRELADPNTGDPDRLMEEVNKFLQTRDSQVQQYQRQSEIDSHVRDVAVRYDAQILNPLMGMLPPDVAQRIEDEAPGDLIGIAHRTHIFQAAIRELQSIARREGETAARQRLRNNDSFRREVHHEAVDRRPEPELVAAVAPSNGTTNHNDWLRNQLRGN